MVKEVVLPFLTVLSNCKTFYEQAGKNKNKKQIEDKWILSRLNTTIEQVTKELDEYSIDKSLGKIIDFVVNDFSRTYIKITRDREDTKEILGEVLHKVSLILAPYAPYISEYVYQCFNKDSVHLSSWPKVEKKFIDNKLEKEFNIALEIIEKGLAERDKSKIGLKWPLSKAILEGVKISKELKEVIANQLNVKKIEIKPGKTVSVKLDTKITMELEREGYARAISRQVQSLRKKSGLVKTDIIKLALVVDEDFKKIIEKQGEMIKQRTNAREIIIGKVNEKDYFGKSEEKIKGKKIKILLKKI
jgi:isoleucyl-tRNA synthetase